MIGHPDALREQTADGWQYADPLNRQMALLLLIGGVFLPDIDAGIEALEAEGKAAGAELRERRRKAVRALQREQSGELGESGWGAHVEFIAVRLRAIERERHVLPLAKTGKKFTVGRKKGTVGRVRKAIRATLKKHPELTNPELWENLKLVPPRGWEFYDNRVGEYIDHPDGSTSRAQFNNICGEERRRIRG